MYVIRARSCMLGGHIKYARGYISNDWKNHIDICKNKLSSGIYAINSFKNAMPTIQLKTFSLMLGCVANDMNRWKIFPSSLIWLFPYSEIFLSILSILSNKTRMA